MRRIIRADGTSNELPSTVGFHDVAHTISRGAMRMIALQGGQHIVLCDEMGKSLGSKLNHIATELVCRHAQAPGDRVSIYGDAAVLPRSMMAQESGDMRTTEQVHDEELKPLLGKVIDICMKHGIPMIAHFQLTPSTPKNNKVLNSTTVLSHPHWGPSNKFLAISEVLTQDISPESVSKN